MVVGIWEEATKPQLSMLVCWLVEFMSLIYRRLTDWKHEAGNEENNLKVTCSSSLALERYDSNRRLPNSVAAGSLVLL